MPSFEERVEIIINRAENQRCADCFSEKPAYVTILIRGLAKPMGAFICFRCVRVHEKFGNDLAYVLNARNEDNWSEEEVQALERGGNKNVNTIFESKLAFDHPRPDASSHKDAREQFCTEKYVKRLFFSASTASRMLKAPNKQTPGRSALKAAAKDTRSSSQGGMNSSDSSFDEMSFSDASFGDDNEAPEAGMNQLSLEAAEPKRPRQRVRSRRRASIGGNDPSNPKPVPTRAMSLQVERGGGERGVRRQRSARRNSIGRTSSMGGSNQQPMRRTGRRGSIGNSEHGSSSNLNRSGSDKSLSQSNHGEGRQRRARKKGDGPLNSLLSASNHGDKGEGDMRSRSGGSNRRIRNDPLGGSSHHGGRRRPQRRGSIGVEDANAKLNEKKEMIW